MPTELCINKLYYDESQENNARSYTSIASEMQSSS